MCYLDWFVCFSTPRDGFETSVAIRSHSITQVMQLVRYCQVSFPFSALRQRAKQWIRELNWNLPFTSSKNWDIHWGKSILYCVYHAFIWTSKSFFFFTQVTHIINHLTHNLRIALPIPNGLTTFSKNYKILLPTSNFHRILAFKY